MPASVIVSVLATVFVSVFVAVLAPTAAGQEPDLGSVGRELARVLWLDADRRGDHAEAFDLLHGELGARPDSPWLELVLLRLQNVSEPRSRREALYATIGEVLARGDADPGPAPGPFGRALLENERYRLARSLGKDLGVLAPAHRARFLTSWRLAGPFGVRGADLLDWRFDAEDALLSGPLAGDAVLATEWGERAVVPMDRLVDGVEPHPSRELDLPFGAVYALSQFRLDRARPLLLELSCGDSFRVFLNGELVAVRDLLAGDERDVHRWLVPGRTGENRLVVKLAGVARRNFATRLSESDGAPLSDDFRPGLADRATPWPAIARAHRLVRGTTDDQGAGEPFEDALALAERWTGRAGRGPDASTSVLTDERASALVAVAAGWLLAARGERRESLERFERAAAWQPNEPLAHLGRANAIDRAPHLPDTWQTNAVREAHRRAVELGEDCLASRLWLAVDRARQGDPVGAFRDLRQARDRFPDGPQIAAVLASLARSQGREKEREDFLLEALDAAPDDPDRLSETAQWHGEQNRVGEAIELLRRALASDAERIADRLTLASLELRRGRPDAARAELEAVLARHPDSPEARLRLGRLLASIEDTEAAERILREGEERFPSDPRFLQALGEIAASRGDEEAMLDRYGRLVDLRPESHRAREAVRRVREAPDPWFEEFLLDGREVLEATRGRDFAAEYPRAGSVALLDDLVLRFYEDGSARLVTHQIFRILNEEGIERHGTLRPRGTLLELRTILPDGRALEPVSLGNGEYTMPGLAPGVAIEWRYEERLPSLTGSPLRMPPYYFQDIEMTMPFVRSRYVVIEPEGLRLEHLPLEYPWEPLVIERDGERATVYDVVDLGQLVPEPGMPAPEENVPRVLLVEPRTWAEINFELRAASKVPVSPEVREAARQWTDGVASESARARLLWERVHDWVRVSAPAAPTATLLERRGSRFHLYLALLRASGIALDYGHARRSPELDLEDAEWDWLRADLFPNPVLRVRPVDGPASWVAAGSGPRYGELPSPLYGAPVFLVDRDRGRVDYLPLLPDADAIGFVSTVDVYPEGYGYEADIRVRFPDGVGAGLAEQLKRVTARQSEAFASNLVQGYLPGSRRLEHSFEGLDDPDEPLVFVARASSEAEASEEDRNMLAFRVGFAPMELVQRLAVSGERRHPLLLDTYDFRHDRFRIHLGADFRVVTLPQDLVSESPLGAYRLRARQLADLVEVEREVRFKPARIEPEAYAELLRTCREIDDREEERIWLVEGR